MLSAQIPLPPPPAAAVGHAYTHPPSACQHRAVLPRLPVRDTLVTTFAGEQLLIAEQLLRGRVSFQELPAESRLSGERTP